MFYETLAMKLNDLAQGTRVVEYLREFRRCTLRSTEEIQTYQFCKLIKLLIHARDHSPYYNAKFKACGFDPVDMTSLEDLRQVPILTRSELLENSDRLICNNIPKVNLHKGSSSGSTGTPIVYYSDQDAISAGKAAGQLAWELTPWQFSTKGLHIWGHPETSQKQWQKWTSKTKAFIYRQHKFAAHELTDPAQFAYLYERCAANEYVYIDGYTTAIYRFALFLLDNDLQLPSIQYVLTTGEQLEDHQRHIIEVAIGPVYDLYGCSEINGIANECRRCRCYHIIDPHVLVQYGAKQDEAGYRNLIITDLDNYAAPLIRYENGDLAKPAHRNKPCSIPFNTIARIGGRLADLIVLKDGGILSVPGFFGSTIFKEATGLRQFQVVRDGLDHLEIRLVVDDRFDQRQRAVIESAVNDYIKGRIRWTLRFVDDIPISKTGKTKLIVNLAGLRQNKG